MIVKAIIADDEPLARNVIKKYLQDLPDIQLVAECTNGLEALNKIHELNPDLVFLDIQMPELDGLTVLQELQHPPMVIFTTAFNQYAIKAFELDAIDYLLKPFDKERFVKAVQKALYLRKTPGLVEEKLTQLQNTLSTLVQSDTTYAARVIVKEKNGFVFVDAQNIAWLEACSDYVKIYTPEKAYLKNISLTELETKLDPRYFLRIHRSTIVNIAFIKEMQPYFNGEYHVILTNGQKLKLSRSYKDKLRVIFGEGL